MNYLLLNSVPYIILLINCIVFKLLRVVLFSLSPVSYRIFISELISTLELCSDCAELGVVWDLHGNIGYGAALLILCVWWAHSFEDAEACPCAPFEEYVLFGTPLTSSDTIQKLCGQVVGAVLTAKYTTGVWCWHLVPEHAALHNTKCIASLQVSMFYGLIVEGMITFISRIVALESVYWNHNVSTCINSFTTVVLVLIALNTTGGYFNPILASALTLGCEGNTLLEHIAVYWIGSLIGSIIARSLHLFILKQRIKQKDQ